MLEVIYKINLDGTGAATLGTYQLEQGLVTMIAHDAGLTEAEVTRILEAREWVTTSKAHYCAADHHGNPLNATACPAFANHVVLDEWDMMGEDFELESRRHQSLMSSDWEEYGERGLLDGYDGDAL